MDANGGGRGCRRRAADRRPGHAGLPAGLRARLRPGPGMARLDRPAVRLRRLGGARRASTWARSRRRLQKAKRRGLDRIGPIAHDEAPRLGLDAGFCRRYLARVSSTSIWARESRRACTHSMSWPCELGLAPRGVKLEFYRCGLAIPADRIMTSRSIIDKAVAGQRLTPDEGLALLRAPRPARAGPGRRRRQPPAASRSRTAPTTSTATSTTPTSAPPSATSAPSTARPATPTPTCCRAKSSTRRSRRPSPSAATRSCCRAAIIRR